MPDNQIYLGNKNLPSQDAVFEYTPHMIKEMKICASDILHFAEEYFFITSLAKGKQRIELYKPQRRILKSLVKNRFVVLLSSRQSGKTTMMTVYALHTACFNKDKRIMLVANKEDTAIMILRRIQMAYEQLPNWLKPGIKQWGKTEVIFGNDSSITISTTTSSAARGESANVLIIDEMAFIQDHLINEFWESVIPIISSYEGTKVFVVSTPNGTGNKFHEIYAKAESGKSSEWHHERIDWWELPGRGKKWQDAMIDALGSKPAFNQEFGNQFIEHGQSAIDGELISHFRNICRNPKITLEDGAYKIWEEPQVNHIYTIGVDVSEGVGQAASVAQIFDITDLADIKQVAQYYSNTQEPFHFAAFLYKMTSQWGKPWLCIERNNCGAQIIDALTQTHNYTNIVEYSSDNLKSTGRLGIYCHTNSKYEGVVNMRYWINALKVVSIYDINTVQEMESFVRHPNGHWKKKSGEYILDDRVMSMIWALFILETKVAERYFDIESYDDQGKPLKINSNDISFGDKTYYKLDPIYQEAGAPQPTIIGNNPSTYVEGSMEDYISQGYRLAQTD
jgi:hypothetical protein